MGAATDGVAGAGGAARVAPVVAPAPIVETASVALPVVPLPTGVPTRVGLGAAPGGVGVVRVGVSVAVFTVQAERIAERATPAAPESRPRRENREGVVSSTKAFLHLIAARARAAHGTKPIVARQ